MSDTNDMRRDFEAWFPLDAFGSNALLQNGGDYVFAPAATYWRVWQAATERATALERERCAVVAETATKRQRTIQGMINSEPAKLCNLASAIRQGGDT